MTYTLQEMITSLEAIGYEIREEKEQFDLNYYSSFIVKEEQSVYNVYRNGVLMAEDLGRGTRRLEWVFDHELKRRMLLLFRA